MSRRTGFVAVLDASALLSFVLREPGHEAVTEALAGGVAMSTVNLAETYTQAVARGRDLEAFADRLRGLGISAEPFTEEDARACAALYSKTKNLGLSLGDRACLALGVRLGLPALTADRSWAGLKVGAEIRVIR